MFNKSFGTPFGGGTGGFGTTSTFGQQSKQLKLCFTSCITLGNYPVQLFTNVTSIVTKDETIINIPIGC